MGGLSDKLNLWRAKVWRAKHWRGLGAVALMVPLFAILAASLWFAVRAFTVLDGPPMPEVGYVAMTLGVVFSLLLGFGLMALLFYSSRHGYDEPPHTDTEGD